jgi:hypothetical protein
MGLRRRIAHPRTGSITRMNGNGYKLLGFVVWRGAKWYARKRVRSVRTIALAGAGGLAALAAAGALARRAAG